MRIAVMGAGAVGGFFGAKLAAASHEVAFIARGPHLDAMRRDGLKVKSFQGDLDVRTCLVTAEPAEVGAVDLILFCVKSYDTDAAAERLAPLVSERTLILSLQNGVDNADKIARLWGRGRTLAGVVYLGAQVSRPGVVEHTAAGRIVFGELNGAVGEQTKMVESTLAAAQVPCAASEEIRRVMWRKLLWNAPFCAIACLNRMTVKEILASDSLSRQAVECMNEVRQAAAVQGFDLEPTVIEDTLGFSRSLGDFKPSMLQDLEAKKPLEYEAFNGIVVRSLREFGGDAPTNQKFYEMLQQLDRKIRGQA